MPPFFMVAGVKFEAITLSRISLPAIFHYLGKNIQKLVEYPSSGSPDYSPLIVIKVRDNRCTLYNLSFLTARELGQQRGR